MADQFQFDEASKKELQTFLESKQAEARLQQTVQGLVNTCWDKCVTSIPGTRFSRGEETCLVNCVERFLDTSIFMVRRIEEQRASHMSSLDPPP
ncbi:Mitochondrial import inner membrane translocase [Mycena kentingensis (nom. inval.)]|nr:Mitochondrial import inner membrane translocase [Mycena kentingensis (nom. inval.)]